MRSSLTFLVLLVSLCAAPLVHAQREYFTPDELEHINKTWPGTKRTNTGMRYIVEQPGDGDMPHSGDRVAVLYVGKLFDGTVFDRREDPTHPFAFRVDRGEVIEGWDQIVKQMKLHEKRLVIIPAALAYGSRGHAPAIPRDAVLVFEIELTGVNRE